jgi:hypothetical protein
MVAGGLWAHQVLPLTTYSVHSSNNVLSATLSILVPPLAPPCLWRAHHSSNSRVSQPSDYRTGEVPPSMLMAIPVR